MARGEGSAFPLPGCEDDEHCQGLSVREYFAAIALTALQGTKFHGDTPDGKDQAKQGAILAVQLADALLAELAKPQE